MVRFPPQAGDRSAKMRGMSACVPNLALRAITSFRRLHNGAFKFQAELVSFRLRSVSF